MDYRRLGRAGLKVSELCLGTMTFRWTCTEQQAIQRLSPKCDASASQQHDDVGARIKALCCDSQH